MSDPGWITMVYCARVRESATMSSAAFSGATSDSSAPSFLEVEPSSGSPTLAWSSSSSSLISSSISSSSSSLSPMP
eukprot:CAMPEP_0177732842 /NCGR_PEP_ID=MMETSP0484_2-20121128/23344_1 /TAXON_ID=354590 /ORGANISM="Rhodomonas lens, Strain RHODO" /LENGTH=75 /DNA_ID=CAMNT_0019246137 /DNA_START=75 /DNA_END=302 /DNA_ORIENTATION=+